MEHATLTGDVSPDEPAEAALGQPAHPDGREPEHDDLPVGLEATAARVSPSQNAHESTRDGAVGWLLYRLQDFGIPAPASTPAV